MVRRMNSRAKDVCLKTPSPDYSATFRSPSYDFLSCDAFSFGGSKKKNHFVHNRRRQDGHIMLLEKSFYTRASHARLAEFLCHDDRHCLGTGFGGTIRELPLPRHGTGTCRDINETALSLPTFRPEHPRERRGHRSPPTTTARKLCLTLNSSVLR